MSLGMLHYKSVLFCCLVGVLMLWYHPTDAMQSVFPDRSRPPGLNDRLKLWWAKEVTPDYHIAGRLSGRQIKYASEGGFKSIVSLYDDKTPGSFGGDYLPTGKQAKEIAEQQSGLQFAYVLLPNEDWRSVNSVKKLAAVLPELQKPVLLYSDRGYAVTFVLLMHLANLTRHDQAFEPKIDSNRFYQMTAVMGMDFTKDDTKGLISEITGEAVIKDPPVTNVQPKDWLVYWLGHPVYTNWYTSGQITQSYISVLVNAGFKAMVNIRTGVTLNGHPNQEEVNLLNIPRRTGTYGDRSHKPRQNKERLEQTRLNPKKPNSYIGPESKTNYDNKNGDEFGDDVGYNESVEKAAFKIYDLDYYHFPAVSAGPWEPYFNNNMAKIVAIAKRGPILIHCATASRAAKVGILGAAIQHNLDLDWALMKSRHLGFTISESGTPEIYRLMKDFINRRSDIYNTTDNSNESTSTSPSDTRIGTNRSMALFLHPYLTIFLSIVLLLSLSH